MRRLALPAATALLTALGVLAMPAPPASAAAATCVAPVLRETMVSQGLPTYGKLVNGKSSLVKLFLSLPSTSSCSAASSQSVVITGGTLTVNATSGGGTVTTINQMVTPTSTAGAQLAAYVNAPSDSIPGDPVFAVPGSALNGTGAAAYNATFSAVLNYTVVLTSKGTTVTTGTTTVPATPLSRPVSVNTQPVRILVVPMGDTVATTTQFDATANTAVTSGMQALSRIMPIRDGVNDLTDTATAGLKWHLNAGTLNLGTHDEVTTAGATVSRNYMSTGLFCGGSGSFPYISGQLANFLQAWNSENPTAYADRVLGVVGSSISAGPSSGNGNTCAEGYAGIATPEAWIRAVAPAADGSRQGITGGLAALELMHTYGGSTASSTFHSPNTNADGTALGRAYNVTTRAQLGSATNRAIMHFGLAPWDDYSTLFEPIDFDFETCMLTGSTTCGGAGATAGSVAATGTYVARGTYDTANSAIDAVTYFDPDNRRDGTDATSTYRLVQRDAAGAILPGGGNTGIRMTKTYSEHDGVNDDDPNAPQTTTASVLTFDVAIPAVGATGSRGTADTIEIWKGDPTAAGSTKLYSAKFQNGAPVVTAFSSRPSASGGLKAYTTGGTGQQPALSPSGGHIAWVSPAGLKVGPRSSSSSASAGLSGETPTWRPDGKQIAFTSGGSLMTAAVDTTQTPPIISAPTVLYQPLLGAPMSHPTYSPDGALLAVSMNGDLWTVDPNSGLGFLSGVTCGLNQTLGANVVPPCTRITTAAGTETEPTWSRSNVIAYTVTNGSSPSELWTYNVAAATATQRVADGTSTSAPAWAGPLLLATRPTGLVSYLVNDWSRATFSSSAGDTNASATDDGSIIAFDRGQSGQHDVYYTAVNSVAYQVDVSGANADKYRLDLYLVCGTTYEVLVAGDRPAGPPPAGSTSASFVGNYDPSHVPAGCHLAAGVTNGYQRVLVQGGNVSGTGSNASVGIYAPTDNQVITSFQSISVAGGATDAGGKATQSITWTITYPNGTTSPAGSGAAFTLRPPTGGWASGTYTLTAVSGSTTRTIHFRVTNDADGDGIPDVDDSQQAHSCYPTDAVTNASNATTDYDNDGLVSLVDPNPCVSAFNATVKFQADSLNLASSGNYVTVKFDTTAIDLGSVGNTSGVITSIGGYHTSFASVSVGGCMATSATYKFNRQALQAFYTSNNLHGYVPIVITVTTSQGTASGFDPSAPTYP